MAPRGRFVALEGIEGSGKTTLCGALVDRLVRSGRSAIATREPGGTPLGDGIRQLFLDPDAVVDPRAEALLLSAARAQLVAEVIVPRLASGVWVVSDRFSTSTLAYQGFGRGLDPTELRALASFATCGVAPDLVLLVDIPLELSHVRRRSRTGGVDRLEAEGDAFHQRVRDGYLELAKTNPKVRVLDGAAGESELLATAWREVLELAAAPE